MRLFSCLVYCFVALLFVGCKSSSYVTVTNHDRFEDINTDLGNRVARITMKTGDSYQVRSMIVGKDSTVWFDILGKQRYAKPTAQVGRITLKEKTRGGNVVVGALIGVALGSAITYLESDSDCVATRDQTVNASCGAQFYSAGLIGAFVGALLGSGVKEERIYLFSADSFD